MAEVETLGAPEASEDKSPSVGSRSVVKYIITLCRLPEDTFVEMVFTESSLPSTYISLSQAAAADLMISLQSCCRLNFPAGKHTMPWSRDPPRMFPHVSLMKDFPRNLYARNKYPRFGSRNHFYGAGQG